MKQLVHCLGSCNSDPLSLSLSLSLQGIKPASIWSKSVFGSSAGEAGETGFVSMDDEPSQELPRANSRRFSLEAVGATGDYLKQTFAGLGTGSGRFPRPSSASKSQPNTGQDDVDNGYAQHDSIDNGYAHYSRKPVEVRSRPFYLRCMIGSDIHCLRVDSAFPASYVLSEALRLHAQKYGDHPDVSGLTFLL
jgi:hypothetical protein